MGEGSMEGEPTVVDGKSEPLQIGEANMPVSAPNGKLAFLCHLGFEASGTWVLVEARRMCVLDKHQDHHGILYAFVADGEVLYIGKSVRSLRQRMYGYQHPGPTQSTNIGNGQRISGLLKRGIAVVIYALAPDEPVTYRGIEINLAAGLEDTLIHRLNPPWNWNAKRRGRAAAADEDRQGYAL
jgi:hypothetical protein